LSILSDQASTAFEAEQEDDEVAIIFDQVLHDAPNDGFAEQAA
jgi:hypothetical protein